MGYALGTSETASFTASFDVTPQANATDADVALSQNVPGAYTDLAAIVRFNSSGNIDVRNGSAYSSTYTQPYAADVTYHIEMVVNVSAHTYTVYVTPAGGTQVQLASNYAFRSEQASASSLNYWTTYEDGSGTGPLQVCNVSIAAAPTAISISPSSATVPTGGMQQFTATVAGTTNTAVTWSASAGTITTSGLYTAPNTAGTYTVTATSAADPTKSASATVTVSAASVCTTGTTTWTGYALETSETASFTASFDVTPQASATDADIALSQNVPAAYTDLAAIVRFNSFGNIDVRNGSAYSSMYTQPYAAGVTYHIEMVVNVAAHTYTVYVTPPGGTQAQLANNYAFRSEQASASSLNYWTTYEDGSGTGPLQVCNVSIAAAPTAVSISPSSASLTAGGTQQFTATVAGTTNTGVTWSASAGTITTSGLYTAPNTAGTYTVTATSAADPTKSASASVSVALSPTYLLNASPASLSFGNVGVGSSGTKTASLSNGGNAGVTVTSGTTSGAGFSLPGLSFPFTIPAGKSTTVTIQFAPQASGSVNGTVSFLSDATNSPTVISLSGTGVTPTQHSVSLTWTASTSTVVGYNVYRGAQSGGPYVKINSSL